MKVSLNTIKQYIDFELPPVNELVARINAQLGGVEEVIDLATKYKGAKIVKVVECEKHPNADKLSVCRVDAGTGELIQIVCGAPNVRADMWAVWLPPESTVPATYGDKEPFVLSARELRGVISNGMLASARELAIGDDHDGIVDIIESDLFTGKKLVVGASFAEVFDLDDTIIDIENKMFTHRPDLFGQLGVAREIAGILGKRFTSPSWYMDEPAFVEPKGGLELEIFNDALDKSPRFMAVAMKNIEIKPSPLWLRAALVAMGGKPINNIVDVTNYIMLLTAQPVHAYDYDKIRGKRLGVRMARAGEALPLLNGKEYTLTADDIVIADDEGAIGLAGIMGGSNSEVSTDTKNIVLEVANFDMYTVRKSSMRHGLFTDALTRFNKGQSSLQNDRVLNLLMMSIEDVAGGEQAGEVFDLVSKPAGLGRVVTTISFINERLGLNLEEPLVKNIVENVEFTVVEGAKRFDKSESSEGEATSTGPVREYHEYIFSAPFWRTDIELPEDIVEEIGRLHGYDRLPRELPLRTTKPTKLNARRELSRQAREALARAGANEVLTYSFVHERILKAAGQDVQDAYQLSNALSPDLQYYRLSLTPSLLDKIHANIKAGHDEFALFEIGTSHAKSAGMDSEALPVEPGKIAFVYASKNAREGASFYRAKAHLAFLAIQLGVELAYEPLSDKSTAPVLEPFEPKRSAIVSDKNTGRYVGIVGEYRKTVGKNFKLPGYAAGFELESDTLLQLVDAAPVSYEPLSRYPSVERDISLKVASDRAYAEIFTALENALGTTELHASIAPIGMYQPDGAEATHSTFRITLTSYEKTLTSVEVNEIIDEVAAQLKNMIAAERV